jgi:hypothetical protein
VTKFENCWVTITGKGWLESAWANRTEGDRLGLGPGTDQVVKGNDPHGGRGRVCERDMSRVRVGHGIAGQNYCVIRGCLFSLSFCRSGFQDLLKVRSSSLSVLLLLLFPQPTNLWREFYPHHIEKKRFWT